MNVITFDGSAATANGSGNKTDLADATYVYVHSKATDQLVTICTSDADATVVNTFRIGLDQSMIIKKVKTQGLFAGSANVYFTKIKEIGG